MTSDQFDRRAFLTGSLVFASGAGSLRAMAEDPTRVMARAVPVEGPPFQAALVAVGPAGQLRFRTTDGERRLATADLVAWGAPAEPAAAQVHLSDGGWLAAAQILESDPQSMKFDSDLFGEVALPLALIAGIMPHPPLNRDERDRLAMRIANRGAEPEPSASDARRPALGPGKKDPRPVSDQRLLLVNGD
ncbi:MAG TPA: hypothetical protein VGX76_20650, partial [Pirellulales bacterium]|nr:hypothetical protein [Pirellulales bacterium]